MLIQSEQDGVKHKQQQKKKLTQLVIIQGKVGLNYLQWASEVTKLRGTSENDPKMWHVVGLSGATCSGKTTLARGLQEKIPGTVCICQDTYFLPPDSEKHTLIEELNHANWELVTSVDMEGLLKDVKKCLNQQPESTQGLLIIEGIVILNYRAIAELCKQKFFITLNKEVCRERRQLRSYDPPDPPGYFEKCVWPMYEIHYKEIVNLYPETVLIDGSTTEKSEIFTQVYNKILTEMNPNSAS